MAELGTEISCERQMWLPTRTRYARIQTLPLTDYRRLVYMLVIARAGRAVGLALTFQDLELIA